jgi:polar amino acid transport system substrate-binding protein
MPLRAVGILAALFAILLSFGRADAQTLPLVDSGKLTWGSAATFPPFEFMDNGKAVGFDVDMMEAISDKLKLTSTIIGMEFKGLIPALQGNRIDAIVSGMYINPERSQVIDFVPYLKVGNQLLVAKGNPTHITGPEDLCGHRVVVPVGTVYEKEAQAHAAECDKAGKAALTITSLTSTAVGALAIKEGRAEVLIASTPTCAALIKASPDAFETAGPVFENNTMLGIGTGKNKPALKAAIDTAFKSVVADGVITGLIKKYGLPADSAL